MRIKYIIQQRLKNNAERISGCFNWLTEPEDGLMARREFRPTYFKKMSMNSRHWANLEHIRDDMKLEKFTIELFY